MQTPYTLARMLKMILNSAFTQRRFFLGVGFDLSWWYLERPLLPCWQFVAIQTTMDGFSTLSPLVVPLGIFCGNASRLILTSQQAVGVSLLLILGNRDIDSIRQKLSHAMGILDGLYGLDWLLTTCASFDWMLH